MKTNFAFGCVVTSFAVTALMASSALAVAPSKLKIPNNSNVEAPSFPVPEFKDYGFLNDEEVSKLAENFKVEAKRRPASGSMIGTEDMISKEYAEFRDALIKARTGAEFGKIIADYDAKYDQIPARANDLKFAVARLAAWLPMKAIVWRMTPMVHKIVVPQQALLATLRNLAEQVKINNPDSHVEAQMLYLTVPAADSVGKEFQVESDFVQFMVKEVYPAMAKSAARLEKIKMVNVQDNGKETAIVFDARIRFGENSFSDSYDSADRFKIQGEAERFAALARLNRRMFGLTTMAAYNWNGHLALRREIGKMYGVASVESTLFDLLPGEDNVFMPGATREQRVAKIKSFPNLYKLNKTGKGWMELSYNHLHRSVMFLDKAWQVLKNEDPNYVMQLDPEVLMARKEQVESGLATMKKLTSGEGKAVVRGAISGDEITVDLKGYYMNPPADLKSLLPIGFARNEDLDGLKRQPAYASMSPRKGDVFKVNLNGQNVNFRNYLYGRAKTWDQNAYKTLFPDLKSGADVARAMRIVNESRGTRVLANGMTLFVR